MCYNNKCQGEILQKGKRKMFEVVYREIDTEDLITETMDSVMLGYLLLDFAYEVISTKKLK
jgi:hypothetical protein